MQLRGLDQSAQPIGVRPSAAQDGPGALQALYRALTEHDPFRIAVVDMQMPGMDGAALARAINADDTLTETRLVLMTSLGQRGDAKRMEQIGFAGYLTKPTRHHELKAALSLALTERDGAPPTPQSDLQDEGRGPMAPRGRRSHGPIVTRHTVRETLNRGTSRAPSARPTRSRPSRPLSAARPCVRWLSRWRRRPGPET